MTALPSRRWPRVALALVGVAVSIVGAAVLLPMLGISLTPPADDPPATIDRPRVVMLTSLPIGFAGASSLAATLATDVPADPLLARLDERVVLIPVDALDGATLASADTLLLAHPRALPPESLVLIDDWLRSGGRALVLADGLSSWPAAHPLGDPRNPPVTSLLTPLLDRWGLTLDAPPGMTDAVLVRVVGRHRVRFASPGRFTATGPACTLALSGMAGDCRLGRGRALVIADADFLDSRLWAGAEGAADTADNLAWLTEMLTRSGYAFPLAATASSHRQPMTKSRRIAADAA